MLNGKVKKKKKKNSDIHKILETLVVKVVDGPSLKGKYQYRVGGGSKREMQTEVFYDG